MVCGAAIGDRWAPSAVCGAAGVGRRVVGGLGGGAVARGGGGVGWGLGGARGEAGVYLLGHVVEGHGGPLGAALTGLAIAMSRARRSATRVLAAAGGPTKHDAVLGALRSGLINTLVTDAPTARHALKAGP